MDYKKESILRSSGDHDSPGYRRLGYWLVVFGSAACLVGCTTIKKAGVTAIAAAGGATAATVLSSGVAAPILGGTTGAFVGSVATEVMMSSTSKGKVMTDCAPDNFWSMLGSLIEMGGWALILIFLLPIVIGWILPGPTKLNKK